jgi:hypothetical protein
LLSLPIIFLVEASVVGHNSIHAPKVKGIRKIGRGSIDAAAVPYRYLILA